MVLILREQLLKNGLLFWKKGFNHYGLTSEEELVDDVDDLLAVLKVEFMQLEQYPMQLALVVQAFRGQLLVGLC